MTRHIILSGLILFGLSTASLAQNVGISNNTPSEKLHIDSGNVKIGRQVLTSGHENLLKFGDGNFVMIGESDADDQMSLTASYFLFRNNGGFGGRVGINVPSGVPAAQLEVNGTVKITDGTQADGKVLTSDAAGLANWRQPASGSGAFKAVVTSTQNFPSGSNTNIIYTTKDYDDATAFFSTQYVVPATGLYHFDAMVNWNISPVAFNTNYIMVLTVNGADVHENDMKIPANTTGTQSQTLSCDLKLTAGQTVSLYLNHNSGILQPILGIVGSERYSFFSGRRVN